MKINRVLIVLVMVFVVLVALVAIQSTQHPVTASGPTPTPIDAPLFTDFTLDNIVGIRLRSPETGATFVLARASDGSWTAPENRGTLNPTEADNLARTMVLLPFSSTVAFSEDKTTYGFTPQGILAIEIVLTNGTTHAVEVGYRTPTGNSYYALVDTRSNLYLLDRAPVDYIISRLKSPPVS